MLRTHKFAQFVFCLFLPIFALNVHQTSALGNEDIDKGFIVWVSNRDGDWEVFRMNTDGSDKRQLTDNDVPDRNARISPDGEQIAWTRGTDRRPEVWLMNSDGTEQRKLTDGVMGEWHHDGRIILFRGRDETETFIYDPRTGDEQQIWSPDRKLQARDMRGAKPSPNMKLFVGWSSNPRGTWIFSPDGKFQKHVHGGCEGRFAADGSFVYWVMTAGTFGKANLQGEPQEPLYKIPNTEYGHTYFPRLSDDQKYLVFGACPNNQHDHDTSDYEIFLMKMENLKPAWEMPIRLTNHPATDRWPDIFLYRDDTPPTTPSKLDADSDGQRVSLAWRPSTDEESKLLIYRIYRNGVPIAETMGTAYTDISTDAKTEYTYQIAAVNQAGLESEKSNNKKVKTGDSDPSPPTGLVVTPVGDGIEIRWNRNPELDVVEYRVYRSTDDGEPEWLVSLRQNRFTDLLVEEGKVYSYSVIARDRRGKESKRSMIETTEYSLRSVDGLIAFYTFTEGQGETIRDLSGVSPPIDLTIADPGNVKWIQGSNGIEILRSTLISSGENDRLIERLRETGQLTVEAWVQPTALNQAGPARIVSVSKNPNERNFTIGQSGSEVIFRLRTTRTDANGMPEASSRGGLVLEEPVQIVATFDGSDKVVYINGRKSGESQSVGGDFGNWQPWHLLLANEATRDRTWLGKIFLVAIYDRALTGEEISRNFEAGWRRNR